MDNHSQHAPLIDAMRKREFAPYIDELRERASKGDNSASIALGYIYFRGGDNVPRDYIEALYWFKKIKLEDDVTGFVAGHLATIYYKGLGVAKNRQVAAKYLRSAALRGHRKSMVLLAVLQKKDNGTLKKLRSSETILRASVCDSKLSVMMRFLALMWLYR
jgi:TPR repeat protein